MGFTGRRSIALIFELPVEVNAAAWSSPSVRAARLGSSALPTFFGQYALVLAVAIAGSISRHFEHLPEAPQRRAAARMYAASCA